MKTGIGVFIAAVAAIGLSWCGLVLGPQLQLGGEGITTVLNSTDEYPLQPTGAENLGQQVYRANGCAACHTEQVRQTGVTCELTLTSLGVYKAADFTAFARSLFVLPELAKYTNALADAINGWNGDMPKTILTTPDKTIVEEMANRLKAVGVKFDLRILATGPDISRGWGSRQSVAADYLYAQPVQLGNLRAGPDLANVGVRKPDMNWQLIHLYAPKAVDSSSTMPPFRYLFELRKIGSTPSPDALKLPSEFAPAQGYEVVPTTDAKNLAAYLASLKATVPLYEAPFTPVIAAKP